MKIIIALCFLIFNYSIYADVLPEAKSEVKITLARKPTTRPMTVAFIPGQKKYYIADGGLAPLGSETEAPISKSLIHTYDQSGKYVASTQAGFDNRSIFYNELSFQLTTITYNVSSEAGFAPNTGIFSLDLDSQGILTGTSNEVSSFNPTFGDSATMPSFDSKTNRYFAKQKRSGRVIIIDVNDGSKVGEINLDLKSAGVAFDDLSDSFIAATGIDGEELAILDVDHKAVLIFNAKGSFVGKSSLPKDIKLRAHNHYNGLGFANNLFFIYNESEGEFGTYYGFKISSKSK
ncbi:hypothetical protein MCECIE61_01216 [Candidatus Methylopumilus planktonicus]|uniref:hypothetical protein n=1 Tax=Candidatus Methylopumilus planktonicus TaxID=1581557 RepID=UPI0034FDD419